MPFETVFGATASPRGALSYDPVFPNRPHVART